MKLPLYQVDAFTDRIFTGNPAAVCPLKEWIPDSLMQSIAFENNLSETAFFVKNNERFHIRWFTPAEEVPLCGHATLAASYVIFNTPEYNNSEIIFDSLSGELKVTKNTGLLTLDFPAILSEQCVISDIVEKGLGKKPKYLYRSAEYMAVFESEADIRSLNPDFETIKKLDLKGIIATAPGKNCDFVSRFFAPAIQVNEDPVTGSAHCILAPFWGDKLQKNQMTATQLSARGGILACELKNNRVLISGNAVLYMEGYIHI